MIQRFSAFALIILALPVFLAACAGDDKDEKYVEQPVGTLYNQALDASVAGNYQKAAKDFDEVDRQHPYSEWATRAQLNSAYSYYMDEKYDESIATLDRFMQLHPGNENIAYAYYLKALCNYEQIRDVQRDQSFTEAALGQLQDVVTRFPGTPYARDARLKLDLAHDHLAGKDMEIGRYYQKRDLYTAAINRFRSVVENYQTTSQVPEALHRLVECYLAIGLFNEAQAAGAVLGYNYPGSSWYEDSYRLLTARGLTPKKAQQGETGDGWLNKML